MKLRRIILSVVLACSLVAVPIGISSAALAAATKNQSKSDNNSKKQDDTAAAKEAAGSSVKGYSSDGTLRVGSIVQLDTKDANKVDIATQKNDKLMYGVVIDSNLLPFTISDSSLKNEVYVAATGSYDMLVSNQGGSIKPGDFITISAVNGVGMKAGEIGSFVIGRAAGSFDGNKDVASQVKLKDKSGEAYKTVSIGTIPVAINVQNNPNHDSTANDLPNFLQRVGQDITHKPVSLVRAYMGAAMAVLSVIVCITILYAGIRSSMISIGRNPLSKKTIYRGMLEVIITGVMVLIIGVFAVYLLLKL